MATEVVGEAADRLSRCQLPVRDRVLAPAVESSDQHVDDDYHQPTSESPILVNTLNKSG
jgi:hypothetical protein